MVSHAECRKYLAFPVGTKQPKRVALVMCRMLPRLACDLAALLQMDLPDVELDVRAE